MRILFLIFLSLFLMQGKAQMVNEQLKQIAIDNNLVGMSVLVTRNSDNFYEYYYGKANINRNIEVTEETMYRVASISKMITATALMILHEQNAFQLDDNVSDYLGFELKHPNYPNTNITFRMLLSHTSSLLDGSGYFNLLKNSYHNANAPLIKELLLSSGAYYTSNIWQSKKPGTYFNYSNLNYGVIATLIEKISNQRFDVFVNQNLLSPLNIKGSFNIDDLPDLDNLATLYRDGIAQADNYKGEYPSSFNGDEYEVGNNGLVFGPQGGFRGSARDLAKFMIMHYNYGKVGQLQLMDSLTLALMHQDSWTYNGSNGNNYYNLFNSWGLGVHRITDKVGGDRVLPGKNMLGHPGEAYGLISDMYFVEKEKTGLIFLTNGLKTDGKYEWGNSSAFYLPEEEVFNVIDDLIYPKLNSLNQTMSKENVWVYNKQDRTLSCKNNTDIDSISIVDLRGVVLLKQALRGNKLHLPPIKSGVYIVNSYHEGIRQSHKMAIITD